VPNLNQSLAMHREALKVFLESLKPFSSEKGFKPPEALRAKRGTGAKRRLTAKPCKYAKKALKGLRTGFARTLARLRIFGSVPRDFGGSMPPKSLPVGQSQRKVDCKLACPAPYRAGQANLPPAALFANSPLTAAKRSNGTRWRNSPAPAKA